MAGAGVTLSLGTLSISLRKGLDMQEMEMKSRVRGRVLLPGEKGYDAERAG
jgi:hypothetical protein